MVFILTDSMYVKVVGHKIQRDALVQMPWILMAYVRYVRLVIPLHFVENKPTVSIR